MKFVQKHNRTAQEVIRDLPAHIAIEAEHCRHSLPHYALSPDLPPVIVVMPGVIGYHHPPYAWSQKLEDVNAKHAKVFGDRIPTEAEREAAAIGSMMGWDVPGADPLNYEEGEQFA